jgi:signal peptidase II
VTSAASRWGLLAAIAASIFVADQLSKFWAVARLTHTFAAVHAQTLSEQLAAFLGQKDLLERGLAGPRVVVFESWWQMLYTQNRGSAFSFLSGASASFRVPFFHLVTVAAVVFIVVYYSKLRPDQTWLRVALSLLLGGALGNGTDRIIRGYVIDFIDWHWFDVAWMHPGHHWPTFNVADMGVSVGLTMLVLETFFAKKAGEAPTEALREK